MPKLEGAWTVGEVRLMVELLVKWLDAIPLTAEDAAAPDAGKARGS